jgi:hypothetical protein
MLIIMKNNFTSQEILLLTNTKFSGRTYSKKNEHTAQPKKSAKTDLAEACWNGMLTEILPEISITKDNKPLTLWELGEGRNIFYLQLGDADIIPEVAFTLNPYALMQTVCSN